MLVAALSQPSIGLSQKEKQVSQEHSKYLIHLLCAVYDFKIAIYRRNSTREILEGNSFVRPGKDFLQSFAAIIGSRWQCLASPLSLTSEDNVSIKRETRGAEPTKQALVILQKCMGNQTDGNL